jgi:hypothetical protein
LLNQASYIGARAGTSLFFNGDIAEILLYRRIHTPTQRLIVESYLGSKYAIPTEGLAGVLGVQGHSGYEGAPGTVLYNPADYLHAWLKDNYELVNNSRNGATIDYTPGAVGALGNMQEDIGPFDRWVTPAVTNVCVMANPANDLNDGATISQCEAIYTAFGQDRARAGWTIRTADTVQPGEGASGIYAGYDADGNTLNTWIAANYRDFAGGLADIGGNDKVGDVGDNLDTTYFDADALHMNQLGYRIHATYLQRALESQGIAFAVPTDIANLLWWFKADSYVGSDGDSVSTWSDSSGNAKHATAASTARPTYKTNIINSLPVMRFDGTSDVLTIPATDMTGTSALSLYMVANVTSSGAAKMVLENGPNAGTDTDGFCLNLDASDKPDAFHRTTGIAEFLNTAAAAGAFHLFRVLHDKSLSTNEVTIWVDLVASAGTRPNNTNNAGAFGNQTTFIGARNAGSLWAPMDVAEIILIGRSVTEREHKVIAHYLDRKYALYWAGAPA